MKSKSLPPLKNLDEDEREREEEEEEEMEMKELVMNTDDDKDDYYFEDPSNISKYAFMQLSLSLYMLCTSTQCLSSDCSSQYP